MTCGSHITNENFEAFMQAMFAESMKGYVLCQQDDLLKEGMEQLMPNMEWWSLDWRIEDLGPVTPKDLSVSLTFRKKVV